MDKSLEIYNLPRLNHEEIENLNRLITIKEIESGIRNLATKRTPGPNGFIDEFFQILKEFIPILLKLFQKIEEEGTFPNSFYEASVTLIPKLSKSTIINKKYGSMSLMNIDAKFLNKILVSWIQQYVKKDHIP